MGKNVAKSHTMLEVSVLWREYTGYELLLLGLGGGIHYKTELREKRRLSITILP